MKKQCLKCIVVPKGLGSYQCRREIPTLGRAAENYFGSWRALRQAGIDSNLTKRKTKNELMVSAFERRTRKAHQEQHREAPKTQ
jgi:hypothetical protein